MYDSVSDVQRAERGLHGFALSYSLPLALFDAPATGDRSRAFGISSCNARALTRANGKPREWEWKRGRTRPDSAEPLSAVPVAERVYGFAD
jgi:hypothetical protein